MTTFALSALTIDPGLRLEIMGSYRRHAFLPYLLFINTFLILLYTRGKPSCGDIDILLSRDNQDGRTHRGITHISLLLP